MHARSFEYLEPRQMLAANPFALGLAIAAEHANDHAHLPSLVSSALAGNSQNEHTNLIATLSDPADPSVTGTAHFMSLTHHGETTTRFMANIEGAAPNMLLEVKLDGVTVGQIMTDDEGSGHLFLSSNPHGKQQPLPANFPTDVMMGDMVSVGTAVGALGTHSDDDDDDEGDHEASVVHLSAALSDTTNPAIHGQVKFFSVTQNGTTDKTFLVTITGAGANALLPVSINGTNIGTLMTNAAGVGSLVLLSANNTLPANFPSMLSAGDVVTVGTTTMGTLA
jgi:hypothetical protein